jgi:glutamate dehydrogenase/leucine dehydrogenase
MDASSTTDELAQVVARLGGRAALVTTADGVSASHPELDGLADWMVADQRDYLGHEAVLLATGAETGALFATFVHKTRRGQGAGGARHWPYESVESLMRDGLRLALGMGRKNALAGLWWGGGKAILSRQPGERWRDDDYRRVLYREFGDFITSLRGIYVTAADAGTYTKDMLDVFARTRHTTCIPPELGGSGDPSHPTARGVVCAMQAALDVLGHDSVAGKTVAMQGTGKVGGYMIDELLALDVGRVVATEISAARVDELTAKYDGLPVSIRAVELGDTSIFAEPCDVFAPNALGGVLNPETIPRLQTKLVCGAANNQLLDDARDMAALDERGITYVPDFLCNRMGIVNCANEQYGSLPHDPAIERHLGREWEHSIDAVTRRVMGRSQGEGIPTATAANRLADEAAEQLHPIWGHRGRSILAALLEEGWAGEIARGLVPA